MQRSLSLVAKATGVVAACLLAYRGLQLYQKNDITIYITEVVHLPEVAARPRRPQRDSALALTVEGKVEVETCLMNSYRFLLKLSGHVRAALPSSGKPSSATASPRSTRHRVMSLQATNNYSPFRDDDSASNASVSGSRKHGPAVFITAVDPIVDAAETETSGLLAFTPACISEGLLCRYTCTTGEDGAGGGGGSSSAKDASFEKAVSAPAFAPSLSSAPQSPLTTAGSGLGSVYVRSCFLESDGETAYCQRLTMEVEFVRPVFGARVVVRLPSKHCRIQRSSSSTGGVGTLTQLMHQPRKCVWDIGEITEDMCTIAPDDAAGLTDVEALMPGAVVPAAHASCARLELVFEQPPPGIAFGEDAEVSPSEDSEDDDDNRFGSTVSSVKSGSSKKRTRSSAAAAARRASAASSTNRSRKREERARKAAEKAARIQDVSSSSGTELHVRNGATNSSGDDVPTVELVFSVNELLSGTAVKKLQVLQEAPNWTPRSCLDRLVLRRLAPSLEKMKLKKLAHYTTWFVQPVAVSQLQ